MTSALCSGFKLGLSEIFDTVEERDCLMPVQATHRVLVEPPSSRVFFRLPSGLPGLPERHGRGISYLLRTQACVSGSYLLPWSLVAEPESEPDPKPDSSLIRSLACGGITQCKREQRSCRETHH